MDENMPKEGFSLQEIALQIEARKNEVETSYLRLEVSDRMIESLFSLIKYTKELFPAEEAEPKIQIIEDKIRELIILSVNGIIESKKLNNQINNN